MCHFSFLEVKETTQARAERSSRGPTLRRALAASPLAVDDRVALPERRSETSVKEMCPHLTPPATTDREGVTALASARKSKTAAAPLLLRNNDSELHRTFAGMSLVAMFSLLSLCGKYHKLSRRDRRSNAGELALAPTPRLGDNTERTVSGPQVTPASSSLTVTALCGDTRRVPAGTFCGNRGGALKINDG